MSTLIDAQYAPGRCNANEFLGLIPNVYNPTIPLPVNLTREETMAVYKVLHQMRSQKRAEIQAAEQEERSLYGSSMKQIPPDW